MFLLNTFVCLLFQEWSGQYLYFMSGEVINVHFTSEIKDIFNKKHLNFLFIIYKFPIIS